MKKIIFTIIVVMFFVLISFSPLFVFAWTNCPPEDLVPNPKPIPVIIEDNQELSSSCIVEADWVSLDLNENWAKEVQLKEDRSYWFSVSMCVRGYSLAAEIKDEQGKVIKKGKGSKISFCFKVPETGTYTLNYRVTELNGSYTYAITQACLSESKCLPK